MKRFKVNGKKYICDKGKNNRLIWFPDEPFGVSVQAKVFDGTLEELKSFIRSKVR